MYVTTSHALRMPMKINKRLAPASTNSASSATDGSRIAAATIARYAPKGRIANQT
jgi:hypothetical protein